MEGFKILTEKCGSPWIRFLSVLSFFSCFAGQRAHAGYFEISGKGSYYLYNNGRTLGEQNTTTVQRLGLGIGYNFTRNTSIEFKYTNSKNTERFTQESLGESRIYRITRTSQFDNYGVNLTLSFGHKKARFRPYVTAGLGYMVRQSAISGTFEDSLLRDGQTSIEFADEPESSSISADAGLGFKIYIVERIALDASFNVFATDLAQEEIFLHYSAAGGLRVIF